MSCALPARAETPTLCAEEVGRGDSGEYKEDTSWQQSRRESAVTHMHHGKSSRAVLSPGLEYPEYLLPGEGGLDEDLIPLDHFLDSYRYSPILTVHIHAYTNMEYCVRNMNLIFGASSKSGWFQDDHDCTYWICRSTGRLLVDLTGSNIPPPNFYPGPKSISRPEPITVLRYDEDTAFASLGVDRYHHTCYWHLRQLRVLQTRAQTEVNLGAVMWCPSGRQAQSSIKMAFLTHVDIDLDGWTAKTRYMVVKENTEDGWTRESKSWLSQANHIFNRSRISASGDNHVLVERVCFDLEILAPMKNLPEGYLFVRPPKDFQTTQTLLRWPDPPAYWTFDPSGVQRISTDEARRLGFPKIKLATEIAGSSWDASVYTGLRKFHEGKGRHFGEPLFQLSGEMEEPFSYADSEAVEDDLDVRGRADTAFSRVLDTVDGSAPMRK
ncbi:hypothetical protein C8R44DRAFT_738277 [Mycena epipterygia]|nr:hypothetical protein C8R44DRAFT_738277 [Mycena epipterygia]